MSHSTLTFKNCVIAATLSPQNDLFLIKAGTCEDSSQTIEDLLDQDFYLGDSETIFEAGVYLADITFSFSTHFNGETTEWDTDYDIEVVKKLDIESLLK